jgi:hypothetical protein
MKKIFVLHPLLFSFFPILFLYAYNIEETSIREAIIPIIIMVVFALVTQTILTLVLFKSENRMNGKKKTALILSLFLVIFFTYGHIFNLLKHINLIGLNLGRRSFILTFLFLLFLVLSYLVIKTRKDLSKLTKFLNIASITLVLISLFNIITYEIGRKNKTNETAEINSGETINVSKKNLPNIYYIILDGYANSKTLKEEYNYDNKEFEDFLTAKGFFIASESCSNYAETKFSLASSLNMVLLNHKEMENPDLPKLFKKVLSNKVMKELKSSGFHIVTLESIVGSLQNFEQTDWNIKCGSFFTDEFQDILIESTLLKAFKKWLNLNRFYREKILCTLETLGELPKQINKPSFIFSHIMLPHPPFMFGRNGEPTDEELAFKDVWDKKKRYLDQLIFTNKRMKNIIQRILSESKEEPVIIIQGDHGPFVTLGYEVNEKIIKARMRILNAYYLPKKDKNIFYSTITPVNTFRLLFNHYLDTNYQLLEDRSYFTNYTVPYKFLDVTGMLH